MLSGDLSNYLIALATGDTEACSSKIRIALHVKCFVPCVCVYPNVIVSISDVNIGHP